jgi:hypothetical protein
LIGHSLSKGLSQGGPDLLGWTYPQVRCSARFPSLEQHGRILGPLVVLRAAIGIGVHHLQVKGDFQLVVNRVSKEYQCADPQMATYVAEVRCMERDLNRLELQHVPHKENIEARELSQFSSSRAPLPPRCSKKSFANLPSWPPTFPKGEPRLREGETRPCHPPGALCSRPVLRNPHGWMRSTAS